VAGVLRNERSLSGLETLIVRDGATLQNLGSIDLDFCEVEPGASITGTNPCL